MNHAWVIDLWEMSFLVYSWKIYWRTIFELHYIHKFNGQSINIPSTCGLILPWTHTISRLTCNWQAALWNIAMTSNFSMQWEIYSTCSEMRIRHFLKKLWMNLVSAKDEAAWKYMYVFHQKIYMMQWELHFRRKGFFRILSDPYFIAYQAETD